MMLSHLLPSLFSSTRELIQTFKVSSDSTPNSQAKHRLIPTWPPYCVPNDIVTNDTTSLELQETNLNADSLNPPSS